MADVFSFIKEYVQQELFVWILVNRYFVLGICVLILWIFGLIYLGRKLEKINAYQLMIGAELERQLEKQHELLDRIDGLLRAIRGSLEIDNRNDRK